MAAGRYLVPVPRARPFPQQRVGTPDAPKVHITSFKVRKKGALKACTVWTRELEYEPPMPGRHIYYVLPGAPGLALQCMIAAAGEYYDKLGLGNPAVGSLVAHIIGLSNPVEHCSTELMPGDRTAAARSRSASLFISPG
eukprot:85090-Hanusia_phi.AAC.1